MVLRCPWCGGVYRAEDLCDADADGEPNKPCVCGLFETERAEIEEHERG